MTSLMKAVPESKRILIIDIIRGFALFGILLVNTPSLNTPVWMDTDSFGFQTSALDILVTDLIFAFAMESFYPIFALLFGIGAAIFLAKPAAGLRKLYLRRMFFLFIIGFLHASLVWWGDILMVYAVLGATLVLFYAQKPRAILMSAGLILCGAWGLNIAQALWPEASLASLKLDTFLVYSQGSFGQITIQRLRDYVQAFFLNDSPPALIVYYADMLGIMLLGMWIQKKAIFAHIENYTKFIILIALITLALALGCWYSDELFNINPDLLSPIKGLSTGLFYVAVVALLCRTKLGFWCLRPLAYNGRMSMSNYLGFNIALSFIFYGYGLGLYGSIGPASQMPIVFALYFLFLIASSLWLKYFSYGPFEYLWRKATYGGLSRNEGAERVEKFLG